MIVGSNEQFEIVDRYRDVSPFLPQVIQAADANRTALGFFPASVFGDFARKENLVVLTARYGSEHRYAGHLLYRPNFPRAHIMQMLILPEFRRLGLAGRLLDYLKTQSTKQGFTSIYARVAEDLVDSNQFWNKQGFYVQRVVPGGGQRNRQILVRCHELATPQLFPTSGFDANNPLGLVNSAADVLPLYLLDLNVLFDVKPRRLRHDDALSLFQAERSNFFRLAISTEVREELRRTEHVGQTDPMEAYIKIYPAFPLAEGTETNRILEQLATFVFPQKFAEGKLSANDKSDLRHVATVIENDLAGLITNDGSILAAAPVIKSKFGIDIVSPAAFKLDGTESGANSTFDTPEASTLTLLDVAPSDDLALRTLLSGLGISGSTMAAGWLPVGTAGRIATCCAVWNGATPTGYATWAAKGASGTTTVRIAVDESNSQSRSAARILFMYLLEKITAQGTQNIKLELPQNQSQVRELAIGFGFRGTPDQQCLTKLILGSVLTMKSWSAIQSKLATQDGLKLPETIPHFRNVDQQIQILTPNGNQRLMALDELETLLSPALFCLPGRPAVLTP